MLLAVANFFYHVISNQQPIREFMHPPRCCNFEKQLLIGNTFTQKCETKENALNASGAYCGHAKRYPIITQQRGRSHPRSEASGMGFVPVLSAF